MKKETSQNFKDQNEYNFTDNLSHDLVYRLNYRLVTIQTWMVRLFWKAKLNPMN